MCGALDALLDRVLQSSGANAMDLPLAIRRLIAETCADSPQEAIERATARSLQNYYKIATSASRISVGILCRSLGVQLQGVPTRATMRRSLEASPGDGPAPSHSGLLDFSAPQPIISIPTGLDYLKARDSVGHELGHVLIHKRTYGYDQATIRLGSSPVEEALAEYAARLLLMPKTLADSSTFQLTGNLAARCVELAHDAEVTIHAAMARVGDPDMPKIGIRGAILWRTLHPTGDSSAASLAPYWHLCGDTFVPLKRGGVRQNSLVARLFLESEGGRITDSAREDVRIGRLCGSFRVDGMAWGSRKYNSRVVLSVFRAA